MIVEIILTIILIPLIYVTFNLFRKLEKMEVVVESYEDWISDIVDRIQRASNEINAIDAKGTFKADDEVGFFFDYLKQIQERIEEVNMRFDEPKGEDNATNTETQEKK